MPCLNPIIQVCCFEFSPKTKNKKNNSFIFYFKTLRIHTFINRIISLPVIDPFICVDFVCRLKLLHRNMNTEEGEKVSYWLAKQRARAGKHVRQVRMVNDSEGIGPVIEGSVS